MNENSNDANEAATNPAGEKVVEAAWGEDDTELFLLYGDCFVPHRDQQLDVIASRIVAAPGDVVLDLCCGAGHLANAILERHPEVRVIGLDGSEPMLAAASRALVRHGARFEARRFDLTASEWREPWRGTVAAVVSSLGVHH